MKRVASAFMSAVLVVGLCPGLAFADDAGLRAAGSAAARSELVGVSAQAEMLADGLYRLPELKSGPGDMFNHMEPDSKYLKVEGDTATLVFTQDGSTNSVQKYSKVALGKSSELVETSYQADLPEGTPIFEGVDYGDAETGAKWHYEISLSKADLEKYVGADAEPLYIIVWNNVGSSAEKVPGWYKASNDLYLSLGEAAPSSLEYSGDTYQLVKDDLESTFGMLSPKPADTLKVSRDDGKITVKYTPSNKTTYAGFYVNAFIDYPDSWDEGSFIELAEGADVEFTIDESYAGRAWPIAPVKRSDLTATTATQYYMAIPPLDKIDAVYDLTPVNDEKMYVVVKAVLEQSATGQDYLTYYLNSSSYGYAFSGSQDEAVASWDFDAGAPKDDPRWSAKELEDIEFAYTKWDGEQVTGKGSKAGYRIPVTIPAGETQFTLPVVAYASDFTARRFDVDLDAMTVKTGSASDVASVSVSSDVADIAPKAEGSLDYTGYVRPYAGNQNAVGEGDPLSNDWVGDLTLSLGDNRTYDQAYPITYEGRPWLGDPSDPADQAQAAIVEGDGSLTLSIVNEYDSEPKTVQLDGNIVKVKMHVASGAPYAEAGTWVERTFTLDFSNRTTATLSITGDELTPLGAAMTRLYNPNSGEHFYTSDPDEKAYLESVGWSGEGRAWIAPESGSPVYRLYNPNAGDHHYTVDADEKDGLVSAGWDDEGIGWYSADETGLPVYRQYNPNAQAGSHNYTTSVDERDYLVENGWDDEGICWYGM